MTEEKKNTVAEIVLLPISDNQFKKCPRGGGDSYASAYINEPGVSGK